MSLRFRYVPLSTASPVWSLDGRSERPRPIIAVALIGPSGMAPCDGLVDTGADDIVFPERLAQGIGIDLTAAPAGASAGVGGAVVSVRYAQVTLRLTDGQELREWPAKVGFAPLTSNRALLGFAGFLQFFEAIFRGDLEEVELNINSRYPGT
jgi:predicted aspartyl protease